MATVMSLGAYAKARNVNKGTVHRCAEKLGIDTSQGLNKSAISQLESNYEMLRPQVIATAESTAKTGVTLEGMQGSSRVKYETRQLKKAIPEVRPVVIRPDASIETVYEKTQEIARLAVEIIEATGIAKDKGVSDLSKTRQDTVDAVEMVRAAQRRETAKEIDRKIQTAVEKIRLEDAAVELNRLTKGVIKKEAS